MERIGTLNDPSAKTTDSLTLIWKYRRKFKTRDNHRARFAGKNQSTTLHHCIRAVVVSKMVYIFVQRGISPSHWHVSLGKWNIFKFVCISSHVAGHRLSPSHQFWAILKSISQSVIKLLKCCQRCRYGRIPCEANLQGQPIKAPC